MPLMENHQNNQTSSEDEERMLPCQYYVNGFCVQGGRCRFYHPPAAQLPRSIRVPPLPSDFGTTAMLRPNAAQSFPTFSPAPPPSFEFYTTPRPTNCYFGQEPDVSMSSQRPDTSFESRSSTQDRRCEEGEVRRAFLPHGITATTKNGLVSYNYPNQERPTPPRVPRPPERSTEGSPPPTMFRHINWNDFLIPGFSPPPLVHVPLEEELDGAREESGDGEHGLNADMPPEGSSSKKMTAKEEFHLKVRMIAMESCGDEPVSHVRSLDSFFRNYDKLESLPSEMLERTVIMSGVKRSGKRTNETNYLPELEEGELEDSDYGDGHDLSTEHSDDLEESL